MSTPAPRQLPVTPPQAGARTVTLAEHVNELRAELRGSLDSRERDMIAAELDVARAASKSTTSSGAAYVLM